MTQRFAGRRASIRAAPSVQSPAVPSGALASGSRKTRMRRTTRAWACARRAAGCGGPAAPTQIPASVECHPWKGTAAAPHVTPRRRGGAEMGTVASNARATPSSSREDEVLAQGLQRGTSPTGVAGIGDAEPSDGKAGGRKARRGRAHCWAWDGRGRVRAVRSSTAKLIRWDIARFAGGEYSAVVLAAALLAECRRRPPPPARHPSGAVAAFMRKATRTTSAGGGSARWDRRSPQTDLAIQSYRRRGRRSARPDALSRRSCVPSISAAPSAGRRRRAEEDFARERRSAMPRRPAGGGGQAVRRRPPRGAACDGRGRRRLLRTAACWGQWALARQVRGRPVRRGDRARLAHDGVALYPRWRRAAASCARPACMTSLRESR